MPVDRYYIDAFLSRHAADIRGHVLEIGDDGYSRRFGGKRVSKIDVLDVSAENSRATIVADLTNAPNISNDTFDCIIITQVLAYIKDLQRAVDTLVRITKPGGFICAHNPRSPASPPFQESVRTGAGRYTRPAPDGYSPAGGSRGAHLLWKAGET